MSDSDQCHFKNPVKVFNLGACFFICKTEMLMPTLPGGCENSFIHEWNNACRARGLAGTFLSMVPKKWSVGQWSVPTPCAVVSNTELTLEESKLIHSTGETPPCSDRKSGDRDSGWKIRLDSQAGGPWGNLGCICIYTSFIPKYHPRFADIWTEPGDFISFYI